MKYYAKFQEPDGEYIDASGTRYTITAARRVRTTEGVNVGYTAFPSLQDALAAWGLEHAPMEVSFSRHQEKDENDLTTTE